MKRYTMSQRTFEDHVIESEEGEWLPYDDHEAALAELKAENGRLKNVDVDGTLQRYGDYEAAIRVLTVERAKAEAERDEYHEDAMQMRSLRSGIRADCADWPSEDREGFVSTLFRFIANLRAKRDEAKVQADEWFKRVPIYQIPTPHAVTPEEWHDLVIAKHVDLPQVIRERDEARVQRDEVLARERELITDLVSTYFFKDGLIWSDASTEKAYYLRLAAERGIVIIESDDGQRMVSAQWADPEFETDPIDFVDINKLLDRA